MLDLSTEFEDSKSDDVRRSLLSKSIRKTIGRLARYLSVRVLTVLLTVGLGLYLTLLIINLGGYVDEIMKGQIAESIGMMAMGGAFDDIPQEERNVYIENLRWQMEDARGLHEPLSIRTARWWWHGITLQWGNAERLASLDRESNLVKDVIFSRLPFTLLLVGAANVVLFFLSLWVAMVLSNRSGKFWDRMLSSLTPISSAPSWVHGVLLLAIFALELRILPFKGVFDGAPPENTLQYILQISEHMVLPVFAVVLSVIFSSIYTWRTFFMVHSGEDYMELAKAKGLPDRVVRRQYLLRPILPSVITSFAMMLIGFWEAAIALELLFQWPGMGAVFYQAVYAYDRPVVVAIVVMFAYLMGISVILLDIVYVIIDPRVRIGGNGRSMREYAVRQKRFFKRIKNFFTNIFSEFKRRSTKNNLRKTPDLEITQPIRISFEKEIEDGISPDEVTRPIKIKKSEMDSTVEVGEGLTQAAIPSINTIQDDQGADNDETRPVKVQTSDPGFIKSIFSPLKQNLFKYPMAVVGLIVIVLLIFVAVGTVIAIPYDEAVDYWHSEGWLYAPRLAQPAWTNFFRRNKLPESIYFNSLEQTDNVEMTKEIVPINEEMTDIRIAFAYDFLADDFPQDLVVYFITSYEEKAPFASLIMLTPDGREIEIDSFKATHRFGYILSFEDHGRSQTNGLSAVQEVFGDPQADYLEPMQGRYELQVMTVIFEKGSEVNVEGVVHGKVFGLFGTDSQRRNLTIAMLWGTPVALTFGIVGAVLTTTTTILLAATSAWFGGIVDEIIQRIAEINITLPALPIAVLVFILYSKSIWVILAIMILMNIFGNSLKEYRAMFMQFKEAPYVEAAKAYGASNWRIIFHYLLPRIIQIMVPQLVISVPSFVFLEATLAYLGVTTPYLPTWGKVINVALHEGTFWGYYYWVLEPIVLVLLTGLAFAFVGFALDKILNPRLRNL